MTPYYEDGMVRLFLGDCREVVPALGLTADCLVTDPPYGETSLPWDRWPDGWPTVAARASRSMWCFGSMRMWLAKAAELSVGGWRVSQDFVGHRFPDDPQFDPEPVFDEVSIIWEKDNGTNFSADRFRRVHEHAVHFYRDNWAGTYHEVPRVPYVGPDSRHGYQPSAGRQHMGVIGTGRSWVDDGSRLMKSVVKIPSMWRRGALHPTEKPVGLLTPLISYACPPGGTVGDLFAGSGSTLVAARDFGRHAWGVEIDEKYAEIAARRLAQDCLPIGGTR